MKKPLNGQHGIAMFVYDSFANGDYVSTFVKLLALVPGAILVTGFVGESRFVPLMDLRRRLLLFSAPFLAAGTATLIYLAAYPRRVQLEWWATGPTQVFMAVAAYSVAFVVFFKGGRTKGPLRRYMWSAVAIVHYLVTIPVYLYLIFSAGSVVLVDVLQTGIGAGRGRLLLCAVMGFAVWLVGVALNPLLQPRGREERIRFLYRNRAQSIIALLRNHR